MKFAIIQEGRVANVILADADWAAANAPGAINIDALDPQPGPGWLFDGQDFTLPPAAPEAPVIELARKITQLAFITRFTDAEAIAIDLASIGATVQAASVRRHQAKVNAATYIDLDREDTRAGVLALEAAGLLAAGRALQILDAPVQDAERFNG